MQHRVRNFTSHSRDGYRISFCKDESIVWTLASGGVTFKVTTLPSSFLASILQFFCCRRQTLNLLKHSCSITESMGKPYDTLQLDYDGKIYNVKSDKQFFSVCTFSLSHISCSLSLSSSSSLCSIPFTIQ